jgi:diguanylate cyclase (GGDEF)-like protein/putative nucleotidyltransferase with HDIG domain
MRQVDKSIMEPTPATERPPPTRDRLSSSWAKRAKIAITLAGLATLGVFALATQHAVVREANRADTANRLEAVYQDARFWVGQEESRERKFRLEPSTQARAQHELAVANLNVDLTRVLALDGSPSRRRAIAAVAKENTEYVRATHEMFAALVAHAPLRVAYLDHHATDPVSAALQSSVYGQAARSATDAQAQSAALKRDESTAFYAGIVAIMLALALVGIMMRRHGAAERKSQEAEVAHLARLVITDALTGVHNHRAFHEDLTHEMERVGRTGEPLALVMVDLDGLKAVNDSQGHLAGDAHLQALAGALTSTGRACDGVYRIGGDEFAVLLPASGAWAAFRFAQRLRATLEGHADRTVRASAGVAETTTRRPKDDLIHEADLALMTAKHSHQEAVLYTPDMEPEQAPSDRSEAEHHTRTLASALALAVDAKDTYTQSHSQTVAALCALIATELGFDPVHAAHTRLAGLLHDVGKIGIPDAILQKPSALTPAEYERMKTHTVVGEEIVRAAEMPTEALWVRHHHERIDGAGYPDGLAGSEIPIESRIIHVVDAYEAMTSNRPYREAPGEAFALEELRRGENTQFDADVVDALIRVIGRRQRSEFAPERPAALVQL